MFDRPAKPSSWNLSETQQRRSSRRQFLCPGCRRPLTLHQPDASHPTDLLGTCEDCRCWSLLVDTPIGIEVLIVNLPPVDRPRLAGPG